MAVMTGYEPVAKSKMASGGEFRNAIKTAFKFCRIPDKWKNYNACGKTISGERLILFKTPLSEKYHDNGEFGPGDSLQKDEEFTPKDLCENIKKKGHKLGLVVDFTNTKRYYDPEELTSRGIEYKKIKCEGKIVPPDKVVNRFKATILSFFKRFPTSSLTDSLVGVHCTHGLNRAGYIVCRYLIECKGYTPDKAVEAFNKARGHEIERENYLEDLKERKPSLISEMDIEDLIKITTFSDDEQNARDNEFVDYKPRRYEPYPPRRPRPQGLGRDERRAGYEGLEHNHRQLGGRDYRQRDNRGYQTQDDRNCRQRDIREYRQRDDRNYRQQDNRDYRERDDREYRQQDERGYRAQDERGYQVQDDRDYRERDDRECRQGGDRHYWQRDNSDHRQQPQSRNRRETPFQYKRQYGENDEWQPMGKRRYHNSGKQSEDLYYTEKSQG